MDTSLVPPFSCDRPAAFRRPGARGEPSTRARRRANDLEHLRSRHRGRRAESRRGLGEAHRWMAGCQGRDPGRAALMGSRQLLETMRDDSGCYAPEVFDAMWAAVPERFGTVELVPAGLSHEDMAVFSLNTNVRGFRLRFGLLADPMDRELAWCCWRIIELGGRIPVAALQSLIRWLASTAEDHPAFHGSLMEQTPREWERALAATYARRKGKIWSQSGFASGCSGGSRFRWRPVR